MSSRVFRFTWYLVPLHICIGRRRRADIAAVLDHIDVCALCRCVLEW